MVRTNVIVPGIGGSGPDHWQSHWEAAWPRTVRIQPASWDEPDLADWTRALEEAVAVSATAPVLICHSLGCLLFAHWRAWSSREITAAFLVAIPDPKAAAFPKATERFAALPDGGFGAQPVMAVASTDDPYDPRGRGLAWAVAHGAVPHVAGPFGHLNSASNLGAWPAGQELLAAFLETTGS